MAFNINLANILVIHETFTNTCDLLSNIFICLEKFNYIYFKHLLHYQN